jgi:FixJ family two-component response regulator
LRKPRVIIFDDDAILLGRLKFYFDKWGYEVFLHQSPLVCLFNGSTGSCKSLASCSDLMISDFRLPQITGLELFQLQEQGGCRVDRKMKAIMSDSADEALLRKCKDSGYRFFQKPFYTSEIYSWVSECEKNFDLSKQLGGKKPNKRHDFRRNIEYCLNSSLTDEIFLGFTVNKSIDGLGIRIFNPLYAGQEITILKGLDSQKLNGTVVWCTKVGEHAYRAGLHLKG